jgi:hypothetical protein
VFGYGNIVPGALSNGGGHTNAVLAGFSS